MERNQDLQKSETKPPTELQIPSIPNDDSKGSNTVICDL